MNVDAALQGALRPLGLPVYQHRYTGEEIRYITTKHSTIQAVFGEGTPEAAVHMVQVHLFLPAEENPTELKLRVSRALGEADFTWPSETDASDEDGQHYVFECEYANGGPAHGEA